MSSVNGLKIDGRMAIRPPLGHGALECEVRPLRLKPPAPLPEVADQRLVGTGEGTPKGRGDPCEKGFDVPYVLRRQRSRADAVALIA